MGPPRTNQEAVSSEPGCLVMAGPGAARHLEKKRTSLRPSGLSRAPGRRREADGSAPSHPHCIWGMNGSVLCPPGFQAKAGSANAACVVGSSWERRRPGRGGGGSGGPAASAALASAVFPGIETPERWQAHPSPTGRPPQEACQPDVPASFPREHTPRARARAHTRTRTPTLIRALSPLSP